MSEKLKKLQEIVAKQQEQKIERMKNVLLSEENIIALGLLNNMLYPLQTSLPVVLSNCEET